MNAAVGGVPDSDHRLGAAADIWVKGLSTTELMGFIYDLQKDPNAPEDLKYLRQMIAEENMGVVHIAIHPMTEEGEIVSNKGNKVNSYLGWDLSGQEYTIFPEEADAFWG